LRDRSSRPCRTTRFRVRRGPSTVCPMTRLCLRASTGCSSWTARPLPPGYGFSIESRTRFCGCFVCVLICSRVVVTGLIGAVLLVPLGCGARVARGGRGSRHWA
jgi:hypothetical protein